MAVKLEYVEKIQFSCRECNFFREVTQKNEQEKIKCGCNHELIGTKILVPKIANFSGIPSSDDVIFKIFNSFF
jgi:hypothetical protein